jgi:hypothetical protein
MLTVKRLLLIGSACLVTAAIAQCGGDSTSTLDMKTTPMDMTVAPDMTTVPAPSITSITPATASNAGGGQLTIAGSGFKTGTTVTVGGTACNNPTITATQIICTIPAKAVTCGPAAVVVTNPDQQSATSASGFTYRTATLRFASGGANLTTGTAPRRIIAADFNKDGLNDLAAVNTTSATVSVFLQMANNTFAAKVDYAVGATANDLLVADINGDGMLDIVTVGGASISLLPGAANGTFGTKTDTAVTGLVAGTAIATGDFDGDAKPDIVVVGSGLTAYVLKNNGTTPGYFASAPTNTLVTASAPNDVAVGDLDKDGKPDIFVTNSGTVQNSVSFFKNGGTTFAAKADTGTSGMNPFGLFVIDLDGDGNLDIVTVNKTSNNASILKGNGTTLTTGTTANTATGPESVIIADLNGDGILDIVTTSPAAASSWSYLQGQGNGSFAGKIDATAGNMSSNIVAADLNKDGLTDIAYNNSAAATVSVVTQQCN